MLLADKTPSLRIQAGPEEVALEFTLSPLTLSSPLFNTLPTKTLSPLPTQSSREPSQSSVDERGFVLISGTTSSQCLVRPNPTAFLIVILTRCSPGCESSPLAVY